MMRKRMGLLALVMVLVAGLMGSAGASEVVGCGCGGSACWPSCECSPGNACGPGCRYAVAPVVVKAAVVATEGGNASSQYAVMSATRGLRADGTNLTVPAGTVLQGQQIQSIGGVPYVVGTTANQGMIYVPLSSLGLVKQEHQVTVVNNKVLEITWETVIDILQKTDPFESIMMDRQNKMKADFMRELAEKEQRWLEEELEEENRRQNTNDDQE